MWERDRLQRSAELEAWLDAGVARTELQKLAESEAAAWLRKIPALKGTAT